MAESCDEEVQTLHADETRASWRTRNRKFWVTEGAEQVSQRERWAQGIDVLLRRVQATASFCVFPTAIGVTEKRKKQRARQSVRTMCGGRWQVHLVCLLHLCLRCVCWESNRLK